MPQSRHHPAPTGPPHRAGRGWLGVAVRHDWQSGERDAVTPRDAVSVSFSTKNEEENGYESGVTNRHTDTPPAPEPVAAAVQSDFTEGFADEYR